MMGPMKYWSCLLLVCSGLAWAQETPPAAPAASAEAAPEPMPRSALNGPLFYQLLLAELETREGSAGAGFSLMLDAARKLKDAALFQRAVQMALQARSGDAALQAAQAWKKERPQDTEPNRYLIQIQLALGRVADAGRSLEQALRDLPANELPAAIASVPGLFGNVPDRALALQAAEAALAPWLRQGELGSLAQVTLGRMQRDAGQIGAAVESARRARNLDQRHIEPLLLAMSLLRQAPEPMQALLDEAMKVGVPPSLQLSYARQLVSLKQPEQALAQTQALLIRHPMHAPAWLLMGLLQSDAGDRSEARQSLEYFVSLAQASREPADREGLPEALILLSQIAQDNGRLDQAERWLDQVPPEVDPIRLALRRADVLALRGQLNEARNVLSAARADTPELQQRKLLAQSFWLREHGLAQEAYGLIKQALQSRPDQAELMIELSLLTEKLKRHDETESVLRRLIEIQPNDAQAYNSLGYSLADRNIRLDEARQLIERAVALAPEDPFIQDSLAWVLYRQGQTEQALRVLQAAYAARPDAEIAAHLGEVLWVRGQTDEATRIWREGARLNPRNETLLETWQRFGFRP